MTVTVTLDDIARTLADHDQRISMLERIRPSAPVPERGSKRRTPRYVNVTQVQSDRRWNHWTDYLHLKIREVAGRRYNRRKGEHPATSMEYFATHQGLSTREFQRWFQVRNTQPTGSDQDVRFRERIQEEIDRMRALPVSRGT